MLSTRRARLLEVEVRRRVLQDEPVVDCVAPVSTPRPTLLLLVRLLLLLLFPPVQVEEAQEGFKAAQKAQELKLA